MNKKKFIKRVLESNSELSSIDTYFYLKPVEHVLSGFMFEVTPNGGYVYRFNFPLFDKFDYLTLLYSHRLSGGDSYIDFDTVVEENVAVEFLKRISGHFDDAHRCLTLEGFCHYMEACEPLLKHGHALMVLGYAYVLRDHPDKAEILLNSALDKLRGRFLRDCQENIDILRKDHSCLKKILLDREKEMASSIGLKSF